MGDAFSTSARTGTGLADCWGKRHFAVRFFPFGAESGAGGGPRPERVASSSSFCGAESRSVLSTAGFRRYERSISPRARARLLLIC